MVYLGILVTRKFLGSQKILTELTAIITQKMLCPRVFLSMHFHFSVKMSYSTTRQKMLSIVSFIIHLVHRKFIITS